MAVSNVGLVWLDSIAGMSLSLFGLGLGWSLATSRPRPSSSAWRRPPSGDGSSASPTSLSSLVGAALALGGGLVYTGAGGSVPLALAATGLSVARGRLGGREPAPGLGDARAAES